MNGIHILLKAVEDGTLLGPATFADLEPEAIDDILNKRDCPPFDSTWIRLYRQMEGAGLNEAEVADLRQLREKAFLTTARRFPVGSELPGYISDDFGLIGKAFVANSDDEFVVELLESYMKGQIPHTVLAPYSGATLRSLLDRLLQTQ